VKIHIQHIFKKLNLTSRVQIAIFVASHRLT
jgi:DNA-binding NarL/FixJ family response regulator